MDNITKTFVSGEVLKAEDMNLLVSKINEIVNSVNSPISVPIINTENQGFYVCDSNGKIALKYDSGGLDAAVVSSHLKSIIGTSSSVSRLPNWDGIKFYFIGDSITGSSTSSTFYHAWLRTWTGLAVYNGGVSGDKLTGGMASRILNAGTDVDIVTVFGGTNDWSSNVVLGDPITSTVNDGTVCGGVKYIIQCHRTRNKTKPILFFSPIPRLTSYGDIGMNNTAGYSLYDLKEVVKKVCSNDSVPFLDQFDNCLIKPWISEENTAFFYNADGLHPNAAGHKLIAWQMMNFISKYIPDNNI